MRRLNPIFSLGCQNFMNRKDPNFSDLTEAIQGSLEKKVLVLTLGMLQLCCLMKKIRSGCFSYMYILHTLTHNINPFAKHLCHSANAHSPWSLNGGLSRSFTRTSVHLEGSASYMRDK